MNKIYVVFVKELDRGKPLPRFQILTEPPNHNKRVFVLEPGECIDAAQCFFGDDNKNYVRIELHTISNIDGYAKNDFVESYTMRHVR